MVLLRNLTNNLGYVVLLAFWLSRLSIFKKIMLKEKFLLREKLILAIIFGAFGILGTYIGTEIQGAIANTRLIGVMAGGILAGPFVGIAAGVIAGLHRLTMPIGSLTAVPCALATIGAGLAASLIYHKSTRKNKWLYGLVGGFVMETFEMLLILLISKPFPAALAIVKSIYLPMSMTNGIGISILILIIQNLFDEKENIAARQAKTAMDIANQTLPYFRDITPESIEKICQIIQAAIQADAVSITDHSTVLAHVGLGADHHMSGSPLGTGASRKVIDTGEILFLNKKSQIQCDHEDCPLKSAVLVPIFEGDQVTGTLKIYYGKEGMISESTAQLAIGLSQIISTQLEISKIHKLEELATQSEIKALQSQINPHFLFNALNTITAFTRAEPEKARQLIVDLSTYLRYNIECTDRLVSISREIQQVKAYVDIERARFGDKLNVEYIIDDTLELSIPSLIIQPLVENAVRHGIMKGSGRGRILLKIQRAGEGMAKITVEDDGVGIDPVIVEHIANGTLPNHHIGLSNVQNRLRLIYGTGLSIERLENGTRISFEVPSLSKGVVA
ncbi:sensor histidine kinase [Acidaminobacter hydrogenoformans]|uniref:histidine kinase n=1 Tax=Acidaminobacter hydrogenoformans DSM 2784 TaxID=1120920 RepID=A0A1G5S6G6_9FIRM|nr:sensor histidine kinase [Acidaminobacter hydrogenoformans]SCZ81687.1 two-component system, LytT family, sensor kinase [Acidaminobacter hydrogenoformans DSM 2784]